MRLFWTQGATWWSGALAPGGMVFVVREGSDGWTAKMRASAAHALRVIDVYSSKAEAQLACEEACDKARRRTPQTLEQILARRAERDAKRDMRHDRKLEK